MSLFQLQLNTRTAKRTSYKSKYRRQQTAMSVKNHTVVYQPTSSHNRAHNKLVLDPTQTFEGRPKWKLEWSDFHCVLCMGLGGFVLFWTLLLLRLVHWSHRNTPGMYFVCYSKISNTTYILHLTKYFRMYLPTDSKLMSWWIWV